MTGDFGLGACFDIVLDLSIWLYMLATDFSISARLCKFLRIPLSSLRGPQSGCEASNGGISFSLARDRGVEVKDGIKI